MVYNHHCRPDAPTRRLARQGVDALRRHFGTTADVAARAPGRLEVLGAHTDYNEGFVTAIAIERATVVVAARRPDRLVRAWSEYAGDMTQFDPGQLGDGPWGDWRDYLAGVCAGRPMGRLARLPRRRVRRVGR